MQILLLYLDSHTKSVLRLVMFLLFFAHYTRVAIARLTFEFAFVWNPQLQPGTGSVYGPSYGFLYPTTSRSAWWCFKSCITCIIYCSVRHTQVEKTRVIQLCGFPDRNPLAQFVLMAFILLVWPYDAGNQKLFWKIHIHLCISNTGEHNKIKIRVCWWKRKVQKKQLERSHCYLPYGIITWCQK